MYIYIYIYISIYINVYVYIYKNTTGGGARGEAPREQLSLYLYSQVSPQLFIARGTSYL